MKRCLDSVSKKDSELSIAFADIVFPTNMDMYATRHPGITPRELKRNLAVGKMAEYQVYRYFLRMGKAVSVPDVVVYDIERKSNDPDLYIGEHKIQVKAFRYNSNFAPTWVVQKNDEIVTHPTENDWYALVVTGYKNYFYLVNALDVVYDEMVREDLRSTKTCINWNSDWDNKQKAA